MSVRRSGSGWRPLLRGMRLLIHVVKGLLLATLVKLDAAQRLDAEHLAQTWSRQLLRILNITLTVHGSPAANGHLVVANHVSWLDIFVLLAARPTRFVAKSEIRDWPVAGWLADALGTFYIRRGKGGTTALLERLRTHLDGGGTVVIFPEGTTSDGQRVLPFHPRLFAAAVDSDSPVQPAALHYGPDADGQPVAPFIGDDTLVAHIRRLLHVPSLSATLTWCAVQPSGKQSTREQCAQHARQHIEQALVPFGQTTAPLPVCRLADDQPAAITTDHLGQAL
jgi:lyso-ornithine lipid O-acyltransferase